MGLLRWPVILICIFPRTTDFKQLLMNLMAIWTSICAERSKVFPICFSFWDTCRLIGRCKLSHSCVQSWILGFPYYHLMSAVSGVIVLFCSCLIICASLFFVSLDRSLLILSIFSEKSPLFHLFSLLFLLYFDWFLQLSLFPSVCFGLIFQIY